MRDFIYLDLNRVNSIIAQSENGLLTSLTAQEQTKKGDVKDTKFAAKSSTGLGGGLGKLAKIEENIDFGIDYSKINNRESITNQVREISVHDAAFSIAYDYLKPNGFDSEEDPISIGTQLELADEFRLVDFDFLENLFSDDGVIGWANKEEIKKAEKELEEQLPRDQKRNPQLKQTIKELKQSKEEDFKTNQEMIHLIKKTLPFTRMFVSQKGFVIPLNDLYFRDTPQIGFFKYGGVLTCVGTITNRVSSTEDKSSDLFSQLYYQVFDLLKSLLELTTSTYYIINPIAVYYDVSGEER